MAVSAHAILFAQPWSQGVTGHIHATRTCTTSHIWDKPPGSYPSNSINHPLIIPNMAFVIEIVTWCWTYTLWCWQLESTRRLLFGLVSSRSMLAQLFYFRLLPTGIGHDWQSTSNSNVPSRQFWSLESCQTSNKLLYIPEDIPPFSSFCNPNHEQDSSRLVTCNEHDPVQTSSSSLYSTYDTFFLFAWSLPIHGQQLPNDYVAVLSTARSCECLFIFILTFELLKTDLCVTVAQSEGWNQVHCSIIHSFAINLSYACLNKFKFYTVSYDSIVVSLWNEWQNIRQTSAAAAPFSNKHH